MNYEEKYKQALERAKKLHSESIIAKLRGDKEKIEQIFPELRESEDERIRKSLIEHIKGITSWNYFLGISKEQMISWLEKLRFVTNLNLMQIVNQYNYGTI